MRLLVNIRVNAVLIALLVLVVSCFSGCAQDTPGNLSTGSLYEPFIDQIYWEDDELDEEYRSLFLAKDKTASDRCAELSAAMGDLGLELPLDSEERIAAYAWELAKVVDNVSDVKDTELYVSSVHCYPDGLLLITYTYRDYVLSDGTLMNVRGSNFVCVVSAADGEILNRFITS